MSSPVWFITGVSQGLGLLLAMRALDHGHRVIGSVRSRTKSNKAVKSLEDKGARVIEMDSTESQDALFNKVQTVLSIYGQIDILVNNAGYAALGPLERFSEAEILKQIRTNTLGPLFITQAALPSMRSRKSGMVVNMSSFVGMRGDPSNGIYALSKFGLEGWSESLAAEIAEFNISVVIAEFGAFRTNFLEHDTFNAPHKGMLPGYEGSVAEENFEWVRRASQKQPGDPEKGVEKLFRVIMDGGRVKGERVLRVPIGADAVDVVGDKVEKVTRDLALAREMEEAESTAL